jgi:hypothetical protein
MKNNIIGMVYGDSNGTEIYMKIEKEQTPNDSGGFITITLTAIDDVISFPLSKKQADVMSKFFGENDVTV